MSDTRSWSIRNIPIDLIDTIRSTAYVNQISVGEIVIEACEEWLEQQDEYDPSVYDET